MSEKEKIPAAAKLRDLAVKELDLFHSPEQAAYATFPNGATHRVNSEAMRRWLRRKHTGGCPSESTLQAAIGAIAAEAIDDKPEHPVFVRFGWLGDCLYLDLGKVEGQEFVKIDREGWTLCEQVPVKFRRPETMLPLPTPVQGGSLEQLRDLINVPDDDNWMLLKSWLIGTLSPRGPYPILAFHGEAGSGKSTASWYLRSLIDPSVLDTTRAPQEIETLNIRAQKTWIVAYDNISSMPQWLSDALCRMVTGAGDSKRKLYTDDDETIFKYRRPAILNGITEYATQNDLLSRIISVTLEPIRGTRRTEKELDRQFNEAHPYILGALLDAAKTALANDEEQDNGDAGRMADFAAWVAASGISKRFYTILEKNQGKVEWIAIESSVVAMAVIELMDGLGQMGHSWSGTATELDTALRDRFPRSGYMDSHVDVPAGWPKLPKNLGDQLMKVAGALRTVAGIDVERENSHDHENKTRYTLTKKSQTPHGLSEEQIREILDDVA